MQTTFTTNNAEETQQLAGKILKDLHGVNVLMLQGELGAGKTTFAQSVLRTLGAEGPFTSPTFVIMKKYERKSNVKIPYSTIYHFDCYRVTAQDILELGWEEIIADPHNLVLVEWPERINAIWPSHFLRVAFQIQDEERRKIKFEYS